MKTVLEILEERIQEEKSISGNEYPEILSWIHDLKTEERKQTIDFSNQMRMIRDIDNDGNIEFMFEPIKDYSLIFNGQEK